VITDITAALASYLSTNLGPDPLRPGHPLPSSYGAIGTIDGERVTIMLTFRADAAYCCMEWGCHLALHASQRWQRFRAALQANGIAAPERLELALTVVVEPGAQFFDPFRPVRDHRGAYELQPASAHRNEYSTTEAPPEVIATP
jgi:hypothetical protein